MDQSLPDPAEVRRRVELYGARVSDGRSQMLGDPRGEPVKLADPSPDWAERFESIRGQLAAALGTAAVRIDHVGSTSIPGIAAKPVIDVQVSVPDLADEAAYAPAIESAGWPLRTRELDIGHMYFRDPAGRPRLVQIHVCEAGSKWERDHLLFRDYLRAHPDTARAYEAIKRAAANAYGLDRLAYTEAKGPFIERALADAEEWAARTSWRP